MADEIQSEGSEPLHPLAVRLAGELVRDLGRRIRVDRDDARVWFAVDESPSPDVFAQVRTNELRLVPFLGEESLALSRAYVVGLERAWTDNDRELVVDLRRVTNDEDFAELKGYVLAAFESRVSEPQGGPSTTRTASVASEPVAPSARGLEVAIAHIGAISFSHANSRFPVVRTLSLRDGHFSGSTNVRVKVSLTCLGREMAEPWEVVVPQVGAETVEFEGNQIHLVLNPLAFAEIDERHAGEFRVDVESDGGANFTRTFPVDIVAYNQWQLYPLAHQMNESLATLAPFVQPNQPAVEGVLRRAREILGSQTESSSTEGYQGDVARVIEIVQAIYLGLQERRIHYSDPPASWDAQAQKVRLVPEVLGTNPGDGVGTCLDTTITFASCLAAAGLHPVLVVITGHALVGVLTGKELEQGGPVTHLGSSVLTNVNMFNTLVGGGFLLPVETTVLTAKDPVTFNAALEAGRRRIAEAAFNAVNDRSGRLDEGGFVGAVDVRLAHQNGLHPLPAVVRRGDAVEIVEYKAFTPPDFVQATATGRRSATGRVIKDESPGRIQNWKRALLDLSANNPLLKLPSRDTVARAFVPPGALGKLEDFLHDGGTLRLAPLSEVTSEDLARGVQSVAQLEAEELATRLFQLKLLHLTYGADTYLTRLRGLARKAKSSLEESGSTSLYVGIGTLKWDLEGKPMESPLILAPVRLTGGTGRNKIFELSLDDSGTSTPNFCLLEKLEEEFELKIPGLREPQEDGFGLDVDKALQTVREALLQRQLPFSVEEGLVLGNFQFSTFRIWKDVDQHWARFVEAPVVKHLVENYNQDYPTPEDPDYPQVDLPLPADESQYEAVQAAIGGETFVLEGPPGTGKSQTITNIIAGALASGKRVLFVAEKPAALEVVKRRLDQVGLGAFSLDLHGRTRKRGEVAAAIREALDIQTGVDRVEIDTIKTELRSTSRELDRYAEALHTVDDVGYTVWTARQRLLAAGAGPRLTIELDGIALDEEQLAAIRHALETFPDAARLAATNDDQPWLLAGDQARVDQVAPALDRFQQLIRSLPTDHPVLGPAIASATSVEDYETLLRLIEKPLPPAHVIDQVRTPGWEHLFSNWRNTVNEWSTPPPFLDTHRPEILAAPLEKWLDAARAAAAAGVFGRKKKLIEAAHPLTAYSFHGTPVPPDRLVGLLGELIAHRDRVADLRNQIAGAIPGMQLAETWHPYAGSGVGDMDLRRDELTAIGRLLNDDTEAGRALRAIPGSVVTIDQVTAANLNMVADGWRRLLDALGSDDASVQRWRAGRPLSVAWSEDSPRWKSDATAGFRRLQRLGNLHHALKPLSDAGLHAAVTQLVTGDVAALDALSAFERGLAQASFDRAWHAASLDGFDAEAHDVRVHRFATADSRWRNTQSSVIPTLAASRRPFAPGTVTGQVGELLREVNKVRGGKPLRYLLEQYHETLSTIMPCFLMSPESVAQFLRPGLFTFDLVIIDEASQVRVAEAVGALGRAQAAVIVGDSKQMPPTAFGGSRYVEEDWDPYAAEAEVPADQESILTEAIQSRIPRRWLSWHYRSQAESLIAFSNANYYEGRLASFPTPNDVDPSMGLHFVPVPGRFLRSGKGAQLRTNPVEAAAVVADIRRRLHDPTESQNSIGVVTFNAQQMALIDSMLQDSEDELILEACRREDDSKLFVKNLENVQGDERDVILFSIGYSKDGDDPNSKLPLQWGPLNAEGGERRLNVAVTRARKQVVIYCSFKPEDIDLSRTSSTALAHLRNYLQIARDGVESNPALIARKPGEVDRHRAEIAAALSEAGLHVEQDKGLSDFRVDLVVSPAGDPDRPALVVLLDGPRWGRGKRTQDRDVIPVEVLGNLMGWPDVMRIWLPDWTRDPGHVLERIRSRTIAAHAELLGRTPSLDPEVAAPINQSPSEPTRWAPAIETPAGKGNGSDGTGPADVHPDRAQPRPEELEREQSASEPTLETTPRSNRDGPSELDAAGDARDEASTEAGSVSQSPMAPPAARAEPAPPEKWGPAVQNVEATASDSNTITEFVPAHTNVVGPREALEALPDQDAATRVREQVLEIIASEGPIQVARLGRIVGKRFMFGAVRAARADEITRLIPRDNLRKNRKLGDFAWPTGLDPDTWEGFRFAGTRGSRTLDEIAPEEIANAMLAVLEDDPGLEYVDDLLRRTAELFGITRLGSNVRARLEAVYGTLPTEGEEQAHGASSGSVRQGGPGDPGPEAGAGELVTDGLLAQAIPPPSSDAQPGEGGGAPKSVLYRRFWEQFADEAKAKGWTSASPPPHNWWNLPTGDSHVTWGVSFARFGCRSELYFSHSDSRVNVFRLEQLALRSEEMEAHFGGDLNFDFLPGKVACRLEVRKYGPKISDGSCWQETLTWMLDAQDRLRAAVSAVGGVPVGFPPPGWEPDR